MNASILFLSALIYGYYFVKSNVFYLQNEIYLLVNNRKLNVYFDYSNEKTFDTEILRYFLRTFFCENCDWSAKNIKQLKVSWKCFFMLGIECMTYADDFT